MKPARKENWGSRYSIGPIIFFASLEGRFGWVRKSTIEMYASIVDSVKRNAAMQKKMIVRSRYALNRGKARFVLSARLDAANSPPVATDTISADSSA
eukprot:scaffold22519_cov66-Phaeocystis_antarctica.AAC.3